MPDGILGIHFFVGMKVLLGKKLDMTRFFQENGNAVPVTAVDVRGCVVTQVRAHPKGGTEVQFGLGKRRRPTKPMQGHLKDLPSVRFLRSFQYPGAAPDLARGAAVAADIFAAGETVTVSGTSKGKGFAGVMKRHGFHGHPASHGHKDSARAPGSIGAGAAIFSAMARPAASLSRRILPPRKKPGPTKRRLAKKQRRRPGQPSSPSSSTTR